ncbi:MAG TPA: helix-turn-helix domain-containing protein [Steroidobacteraceae bacterium]|jgi:IclR family mhp operon transcriptional activator|nr:helix-turn-helix domain-containing protein [Steroidobacteraceae bacterium]
MESTRPIRALVRGLDALTVLNLRDGATVSEVAHEIRLPRTTVYRILETLCNAGFVYRDDADDRYRLTILVRGLSDGFDDEAWVTQIARPFINELCREIVWPVSIATLSGTGMLVRESTDHASPLAIERYSAGIRVPVLSSAGGRAYLAHCPRAQRDTLIGVLARSGTDDDRLARARPELERLLAEIAAAGYAVVVRSRRLLEEVNVSVPVLLEDRVLASLTVRFAASAVPQKSGIERFVPRLRHCAARISNEFFESRAEARSQGASTTAV